LAEGAKTPPSALRAATSPSQVDGEKRNAKSSPSTCDGEGDRRREAAVVEGLARRPGKPARTVRRARQLRQEMSLPEVLLWCELRSVPGVRFRRQHEAGPYVIDFLWARANLAIEIDGISHNMGERPERDEARDAWLRERRIDTMRISAREVLADVHGVAASIVAVIVERLERFGKTPPSALRAATSPSHVDGLDRA
jgi:very-short-patch-repair endonuclease